MSEGGLSHAHASMAELNFDTSQIILGADKGLENFMKSRCPNMENFSEHHTKSMNSWFISEFALWDADIFKLDEASLNNPLVAVAYFIAREMAFFDGEEADKLSLGHEQFLMWAFRVQRGYLSSNTFHNACHAADVTQTIYYFLERGGGIERAKLSLEHQIAAVVGGMCHDFGHPALNNVYLIATQHTYAIRYNDKAVLEMHHVAASFAILHENSDSNFFTNAPRATYEEIRKVVVHAVLSTDMAMHFIDVNKLKAKNSSDEFLVGETIPDDDKLLLISAMVHGADISNPAKSTRTYVTWTSRVMVEFFNQGDKERDLGLKISMFMDRETTNIAKCQIGFIDILVGPLYAF